MGSPRSPLFDDIYFSPDDGPAETAHVFHNNNELPAGWDGRAHFTVAELGFGTGLNFLLTARLFAETAADGAWLDYLAVEKYPLTAAEIADALRIFAERIGADLLEAFVASYPPRVAGFHRIHLPLPRGGGVRLTLVFDDVMAALPEMVVPNGVDAWFLDGFAPAKNPAMWQPEVFAQMARLSAAGARFATFTAAGFVKRGLTEAGFTVEKVRGFGRKREMLRGYYNGAGMTPQGWHTPRVAVIGGGLAGCAAVWALRARGLAPVLFEADDELAGGASGNPVGLCNPRLSAQRTPQSGVYTAGYARAVRLFPTLDCGFERRGNLHFMQNEERQRKFTGTRAHWGWHDDHMRRLDAREASAVAGVDVPCEALFLPDTGAVHPAALCRAYADGADIRLGAAAVVTAQDDGRWDVAGAVFDAVILATGAALSAHHHLPLSAHLPLRPVRGQISFATVTAGGGPQVNLCYGGYVGAARDGVCTVGATFQRGEIDTALRDADDAENLAKLAVVLPDLAGRMVITGARAGVRCATRDHFPVVGALGGGLYASLGHGSHGIVTSLAAAEVLADMVSGAALSLPAAGISALSPQRFGEAP